VLQHLEAMSKTPTPNESGAYYHFYKTGLQYYAMARSASFAAMLPLNGNLFHHAVEMILKGKLTHILPLKKLQCKYRHNLRKTWRRFKRLFPIDDLTPFDNLINRLDDFENLRYPDSVLANGCHISFDMGKCLPAIQWHGQRQPLYQLSLPDIDAFLSRLIVLCSINPMAYLGSRLGETWQMILRDNASCASWFQTLATSPGAAQNEAAPQKLLVATDL
jgi:hypothetical protein